MFKPEGMEPILFKGLNGIEQRETAMSKGLGVNHKMRLNMFNPSVQSVQKGTLEGA